MPLQKSEAKRRKRVGRGASPVYSYRYQFMIAGRRATIRLGVMPIDSAEEIARHIKNLVDSKKNGTEIKPETTAWTKLANPKLVTKLVKAGLCQANVDPLVTEFVSGYIESRKSDWAENTETNFRQLEKLIKERFANRRMTSITRQDAIEFYNWMRTTKNLGENTARRKLGRSREMFLEAVEQNIIQANPFKTSKLRVAVGAATKVYVDEATINEVIEHCPTTEWKLLLAFGRYVGCRMPSEIEELTWDDINVDKGTILIKSPKTKRYGKAERLVPLFPEVASLLSLQHLEVAEGEVYVFPKLRKHTNLGTTAKRYVKAAGILPWSDFWNTLRASRETDLMDSHGPNDACRWIGNTLAVAARHYQLMRKEAYSGRIQKSDAKSGAVTGGNIQKHSETTQSDAIENAKTPINSLVYREISTPNRTRTCD